MQCDGTKCVAFDLSTKKESKQNTNKDTISETFFEKSK